MIKDMELFIPGKKKLKDFKELVIPYFEKVKTNLNQINTLTQLRDTLLPKLMSGEVRVEN
jgi:type I restriction enzyme S subunit